MELMKQTALLLNLIDRLSENEGNTSEVHLQKHVYFLQELLEVPLNFEFIMYKNSPYSFDFRDNLTSLRADWLLTFEINRFHRPCFVTTELGKSFQTRFPITLKNYQRAIDFIVDYLGSKQIRVLGQWATTLFIERFKDKFSDSSDNMSLELDKLKQAIWVQPDEMVIEQFADISSKWSGETPSFA